MSAHDILILFLSGIMGGAVNAIAGGGTFFTFPAFMSVGLPAIVANATNSLSIFPGHAAGVLPYLKKLKNNYKHILKLFSAAFLGGLTGSILLIYTSETIFRSLVPWLIGAATIIFALAPYVKKLPHLKNAENNFPLFWISIFIITIYGGYFGAGQGVILLAVLSLLSSEPLNIINMQKNLYAVIANSSALIMFVFSNMISWNHGLVVMAGAILGGYIGGRLSHKIPANYLRVVIIIVGTLLTIKYAY